MSGFTFVYDAPEAVRGWIERHIGEDNAFGEAYCIGIGLDGKPIAGVAYYDFHSLRYGSQVSMAIAATDARWATKRNIGRIFDYPFNHLGCNRATVRISARNQRSIKLCLGVGFRKEGEIQRGWDGKTNMLVLGMLAEQCRWLKYLKPGDSVADMKRSA